MNLSWRIFRKTLVAGLICMVLGALGFHAVLDRLVAGIGVLSLELETSAQVLDRHGLLLRAFTADGGRWRLAAKPKQLDPLLSISCCVSRIGASTSTRASIHVHCCVRRHNG